MGGWVSDARRWWRVQSRAVRLLIPASLSAAFSGLGHLAGATDYLAARLQAQTLVERTGSAGKLNPYHHPITAAPDVEKPGSIRIVHAPCEPYERDCYVQLTPRISSKAATLVTVGSLFSLLTGLLAVVMTASLSRRAVLRGTRLRVEQRVDDDELHHVKVFYYGLETDEDELKVPVYYNFYYLTHDGVDVSIQDISTTALPGHLENPPKLAPVWFKETPIYNGCVTFTKPTSGPIDFAVEHKVLGNMALNAEAFQARWGDRSPAPEDFFEWHSSADWDRVEIVMEWPETLCLSGNPVAKKAREPAAKFVPVGDDEFVPVTPRRWELTLENVHAHTIYRFEWTLASGQGATSARKRGPLSPRQASPAPGPAVAAYAPPPEADKTTPKN